MCLGLSVAVEGPTWTEPVVPSGCGSDVLIQTFEFVLRSVVFEFVLLQY